MSIDKIKIVHCADIHLDSPLRSNIINRQTLRDNFEAICKYANEQEADLLLVCGDIIENDFVSNETAVFLEEIIKKYSNIHFVFCSGNHDYYQKGSIYDRLNFKNVTLFLKEEMESVEISALDTVIYGFGATTPHSANRFLKNFKVEDNNKINIMLFHGDIIDEGGNSEYYPVTKKDIENSGCDYIALGHIHKFSDINRAGQTYYAYSGTPQGKGFDETGDKGVISGTISKTSKRLDFVPISKIRFNIVECDITDCENNFSVKEKILQNASNFKNDAVRLILTGELSESNTVNKKNLEQSLKEEFFYLEIQDNTKIKIDIELLKEQKTLTGFLIKELMSMELSQQQLESAVKTGISVLSQDGGVEIED